MKKKSLKLVLCKIFHCYYLFYYYYYFILSIIILYTFSRESVFRSNRKDINNILEEKLAHKEKIFDYEYYKNSFESLIEEINDLINTKGFNCHILEFSY